MLKAGNIKPSLIDKTLLSQIKVASELNNVKSPIYHEFESIFMKIILFIKKNIFYITILCLILGYGYYSYNQHKHHKRHKKTINLEKKDRHRTLIPNKTTFVCDETNKQMLPGDYVNYGNQTEILQRPIVSYPSDDINASIRRYWLNGTHHTNKKHIPRYLEIPKLCDRQPTYENSMTNIYGQPIGPMMPVSQYSQNDPLKGYEDTYYRRTDSKIRDCSDDFDDLFYSDNIY